MKTILLTLAALAVLVSLPRPATAQTIQVRWKLMAAEGVPSFPAGATPVGQQMKSMLLSDYIAYTGPCTIDEAAGKVVLKVEAAWRPDYVGTEQTRYFRFENGKMYFGVAPNSLRVGDQPVTRRLTLERAAPTQP